MKSYSDEFPLLEGVNLYASDISGDGDCLFHALSDQVCISSDRLWLLLDLSTKYFNSFTAMKTIMQRFAKR